jgi:hypothetical protein
MLNEHCTHAKTLCVCALAEHRRESGDFKEDELYAEKPFTWLICKLGEIGCNILQTRPTDPKPLPAPG